MKNAENPSTSFPPMDMVCRVFNDRLKVWRAELPSVNEIASTGRLVDPEDVSVPGTIRAIARAVQMAGKHDTVHVIRWPDGITTIVQGNLSNRKRRRKLLLDAYFGTYNRLVNQSFDAVLDDDVQTQRASEGD